MSAPSDAALAAAAIPRALASGKLSGALAIIADDCHVLTDGARVFGSRGALRTLAGGGGPKNGHLSRLIDRFSRDSSGFAVGPRIRFIANGKHHNGIRAEDFVRLCTAITDAALRGELHPKQLHLLENARRIEKALAGVGLVALIDEACGYQRDRAPDELSRLLDRYLLSEPAEGRRRFKESLYKAVAKVYGFTYNSRRRPPFLAQWTWQYVYCFLPAEVRAEIRERNPRPHEGVTRHHHFLTPDPDEYLKDHLVRLTSVLHQSASVADFKQRFEVEFRGAPLQLAFGTQPEP